LSMKSHSCCRLSNCEGKGLVGCFIFIVLMGIAIFLAIQLVPVYYSNYSLESETKTEVSRAGANFLDDDAIIRNILDMAKRNEIRLTRQNIKLQRFAGQIQVEINYAVPVDFGILQRDVNFKILASSYIGTL